MQCDQSFMLLIFFLLSFLLLNEFQWVQTQTVFMEFPSMTTQLEELPDWNSVREDCWMRQTRGFYPQLLFRKESHKILPKEKNQTISSLARCEEISHWCAGLTTINGSQLLGTICYICLEVLEQCLTHVGFSIFTEWMILMVKMYLVRKTRER